MPHGGGPEWWHWMRNGRGDKGYLSIEIRRMIYNSSNEKCNNCQWQLRYQRTAEADPLVVVPVYSIIGKEGC